MLCVKFEIERQKSDRKTVFRKQIMPASIRISKSLTRFAGISNTLAWETIFSHFTHPFSRQSTLHTHESNPTTLHHPILAVLLPIPHLHHLVHLSWRRRQQRLLETQTNQHLQRKPTQSCMDLPHWWRSRIHQPRMQPPSSSGKYCTAYPPD